MSWEASYAFDICWSRQFLNDFHLGFINFIPTMAYFEFLPLDEINGHTNSISQLEQEHLVDLADVKLGQEYELVVTTYAGN